MNLQKDWRLQGQEKYLAEKEFRFKTYMLRTTKTDHDHCEFCNSKFSENIPDTLHEGYTTLDNYRWVCSKCFSDFKEWFKFKLLKENEER